jgi:uncharacterized repeat protein (TIGR03803 family)
MAALIALGLGLLAASPAKAQVLTTLYSFCQGGNPCVDGANPFTNGLVQGNDGNFYGLTYNGGANGFDDGTAFQITPSGSFTTLYSFCAVNVANYPCADGQSPVGLTQGTDGYFYGTTYAGGTVVAAGVVHPGEGTIFKMSSTGSLETVAVFCDSANYLYCPQNAGQGAAGGDYPRSGLIQAADGNFYGTTSVGGNPYGGGYGGTVYQFSTSNGMSTVVALPTPDGSSWPDGSNPWGNVVQGADGNFYGTTSQGTESGTTAYGTVFKVTPSGTLTLLYIFCSLNGCADGANPYAGPVEGSDGNFYGTTYSGGANNGGTVFKITPDGTLTTLYAFCSQPSCTDGAYPTAGVIQGADGNFYGTTSGGVGFPGTVFEMTSSGALATLYGFCSQPNCADGQYPRSPVIQGTDGALYGTTAQGGSTRNGSVFKLSGSPAAGVAPASLTFGSQDVGTTSAPQTVTLSNTGTWPLMVSTISPSGGFAQTNNCPTLLIAGNSCTINVTFTPAAIGIRNGMLTITDNSNNVPGSQQTVSLTGTGINPGASLSPASLTFGNQVINTTSAAKKVTLTSTGTTNLMFSGITFTGANAGDFSQTNNCPGTLNVGAKCTINVTFTPSILGAESATLDVNDNAANNPQTGALSGTGVLPVTLMPTTLAFGNQPQGIPSAAKNLTLTNNQSVALTISSITTNNADYTQTNTCGGSLAAKSHCTITVTFEPSIVGADNGTLSVADSASNSPQTASLTGTGIAQATVSPVSLTFAAQKVGTTSGAKNVTLTNDLGTALTFSGVTFAGADPSDFASPSNTCGASVPAKSRCTISVTFKPTATGTRTGTLSVNDSANNSPQTVSLTGTGK